MGEVRQAVVVDPDVAAVVDLQPGFLQPQPVAVRDRPDREDGVRAVDDPAVLADDAHRVPVTGDGGRPRPLEEGDAPFEERVFEN